VASIPLTPSRPFGLEISLSIYSNKFFYEKFTEKSWVPGGTCCYGAFSRMYFLRKYIMSGSACGHEFAKKITISPCETPEKAALYDSTIFRTSIGTTCSKRKMPNGGVGIVDFKIYNPYTNTSTNKIGNSTGNDTTSSKAMKYSQYVNNPRGFKNVIRYSYADYVAKYGSTPPFNTSCYNTPPFKPQVLRSSNNHSVPPDQQFMFQSR
jgi:hypothetical protein